MKQSIVIIGFLLIFSFYNLPSTNSSSPDPVEGVVLIKGGCYEMGDVFGDGDKPSKPAHTVCLKDFYLVKEDVTVKAFRKFTDEAHYQTEAEEAVGCVGWNGKEWKVDKNITWRTPGFKQTENNPVVCVTWNDANRYIEWKNKVTGLTYRLPTEAEWEYAARNRGKNIKFSWGGDGQPNGNIADLSFKKEVPNNPVWEGYNDGYPFTSPVRSFTPSELGLYDMTGNVWQWVQDWYSEEYYKQSPKDNPKGPVKGEMRGLRGGCWANGDPANLRTTYRGHFIPDARSNFLGFRLALSPSGD